MGRPRRQASDLMPKTFLWPIRRQVRNRRFRPQHRRKLSKMNRVAFLGSKALGLACLKKIYALTPESLVGIVTFDDTDDTRTSLREFQAFAKDNQLDLRVAASPRDAEKLVVELV